MWRRSRKAFRMVILSFIFPKRMYGMIDMIGEPPFVR
jgi:hypothetical protein